MGQSVWGNCYSREVVAIIILSGNGLSSAYTLWSVLLAWNDVSKVAIFGFVNPLCSVILSALILGEVKQAFNIGKFDSTDSGLHRNLYC